MEYFCIDPGEIRDRHNARKEKYISNNINILSKNMFLDLICTGAKAPDVRFRRRKFLPENSGEVRMPCRRCPGSFLNRGKYCGFFRTVVVVVEGGAKRGKFSLFGREDCFISVSRHAEHGGVSAMLT